MDGREGMAMPGAASYYIHHRGITGPGFTNQPGLHGAPSTTRPMSSSPPPSLPVSSPAITVEGQRGTVGSGFQVESPTSISLHGGVVGGGLGSGQGMPVKKKRGRPRKYGPDGTVALTISPMASTSPGSGSGSGSGMRSGGSGSVSASGSAGSVKRGRGRPPGTGRKQQLASLGEWVAGSAGMAFTPHVIMISVGEDIATKIMSFSQQGPRAICILSANGAVSTVTLRQPATSGGTVTYEGRFEILSLSGSYLVTDDGGSRSRSGGLSISLSSPDGRVIGGGVGGLLIAASHVQVIVGSFMYGGSKAKNRIKAGQEPQESEHAVGDKQSTLSSGTLPNQGHPASTLMGGWHSSRQMEMGNAHIDINLTRG